MGCVSSSEADTSKRPVERSAEPPAQNAAKQQPSVPTKSSGSRTAAVSHQTAYDTELAASLVEGGGSAVAYHGLLLNSGKLSLKRVPTIGNSKVFVKSVHPSDDGYTAETPSDPSDDDVTTVRGIAMTMPYTVIVAGSLAEDRVNKIITKVFDDANRVLNGWNTESEVSKLNGIPPGKSMQVSSELLDLFGVVDKMHSLTEGRFDPTTGALSVSFENCIKTNARPPLPSEVKALKFGIGWRKRIERKGTKISRTNANTVVDLDGISKGYVIDKVVAALITGGYGSCYVDWAGDVRASGNHPSGRPWRSAILVPPPLRRMFSHWQKGTLKEMLQTDDIGFFANFSFLTSGGGGAIATSGDYFSIQKYGYHHIASSDDLTVLKASQTSVASVCVAAAACAVADAIATAAMTFRTVEEAVAFLKRTQSATPQVVFGFCVMSRESSKLFSPDTYSANIFFRAVDTDSSATETQAVDSRHNSVVSDENMKDSRTIVTQNIGEIHFNNEWFLADSFTPCSMQPEQLITFVSPTSFVSAASLDAENDLNKLFCIMPGFQSESSDGNNKSVRVQMRFRRIVEHGASALIVTAVEGIELGSASIIEIPFREGASARTRIKLSVPRSAFGISPLVSQTRDLFRQVPSMVWILGTKSADQVELAITATSVTVPRMLENMLCFNITHSSTFFAGIGGLGARIRGHVLSVAQKGLADTFVTRSNLSLDAVSTLESDSIMTTDCTVELVESVQDHIVVLARINDIRYADKAEAPLLWLQGRYLDM